MTEIQNHLFHPLVQPALLLGAAYFAGSERFIQYFPETSRGGLLLKAAWGSSALYASETWAPQQETPWESSMRLTAAFACGALGAAYAAKPLKGRVRLSPEGAWRFTVLEGSIQTGLILVARALPMSAHVDPPQVSSIDIKPPPQDVEREAGSPKPSRLPAKTSPRKTIYEMTQEWHAYFSDHPEAWKSLSEDDRTDYAQKFYEADLSPLPLQGLSFDLHTFFPKDRGELTPHQTAWRQEITQHHFPLCVPLVEEEYPDKENIPPEVLERYEQFKAHPEEWQALSVEDLDQWSSTFYHADLPPLSLEGWDRGFPYFLLSPSNVEFTSNQLFWISEALLENSISQNMVSANHKDVRLEKDPSPLKAPVVSLEASLKNQSPQEILTLSKEDLQPLFQKISPSLFQKLPYYYQIAYNIAFFNKGFKPFYIKELTDAHCTAIMAYDGLHWVHAQFQKVPSAFAALDPAIQKQLTLYFQFKNLEKIPDPKVALPTLSSQDIHQWSTEETLYWKVYMEKNPDAWNVCTNSTNTALQEMFRNTSSSNTIQYSSCSPKKRKPSGTQNIPLSPPKKQRPPHGSFNRAPLSPLNKCSSCSPKKRKPSGTQNIPSSPPKKQLSLYDSFNRAPLSPLNRRERGL